MENPMGLDGFEFVEFSAPEPGVLESAFSQLGFSKVAEHRSKNVHLWRQGDVNFIVNYEPRSLAYYQAEEHGPCACGLAFRVHDAHFAYERAIEMGELPGREELYRFGLMPDLIDRLPLKFAMDEPRDG